MRLELMTRPECHLCEQAAALLNESGAEWHPRNIEDSVQLLKSYSVRIPVVVSATGAELGWPFDAETLNAFLNE